ncbi:hypothetical protein [Alkalihalobacillus pseudalcaliphilus]|uniref:hypothetical protein n=1 Tax=Alkalihalobacillus pseudalcaliphilus TaxID=79884 RepID=UPI00064D8875|nr:hypothetical protein [Alkalihalobacillus pseudalcaliphilus]KMK76208.1 hypothetical protein AB990_13405 [Alkalihalobacillus pseudalcaliphilus]
MNYIMSNLYVKKESAKDKIMQWIENWTQGYNGPPFWFIVSLIVLAAIAIIVITAASIFCMQKGYSYYGVDWKKGNVGQIGVGCLR